MTLCSFSDPVFVLTLEVRSTTTKMTAGFEAQLTREWRYGIFLVSAPYFVLVGVFWPVVWLLH
jgi:hypothetical protein